jgi:hypothetical protein
MAVCCRPLPVGLLRNRLEKQQRSPFNNSVRTNGYGSFASSFRVRSAYATSNRLAAVIEALLHDWATLAWLVFLGRWNAGGWGLSRFATFVRLSRDWSHSLNATGETASEHSLKVDSEAIPDAVDSGRDGPECHKNLAQTTSVGGFLVIRCQFGELRHRMKLAGPLVGKTPSPGPSAS